MFGKHLEAAVAGDVPFQLLQIKEEAGGLGRNCWDASVSMACERIQEELACLACDPCNQQAPSHFKHAISPQTEACFSTTHGFNSEATAAIAASAVARRSTTNLIIKSATAKATGLVGGSFRVVQIHFFDIIVYVFIHVFCIFVCERFCFFFFWLQSQQGKLFTTWLVIKRKYAPVEAYQRLLHLAKRALDVCFKCFCSEWKLLCGRHMDILKGIVQIFWCEVLQRGYEQLVSNLL